MNERAGNTLTALTVASALLMGCATSETAQIAHEQDRWEQHKQHCDDVLYNPARYPTDTLIDCTKRFEIHREVGDLSLGIRSKYAVAFSQLYYDAPGDYERQIASQALARMCVPLHPMNDDGQVVETVPETASCAMGLSPSLSPGSDTSEARPDPVQEARQRLEPLKRARVPEPQAKRDARRVAKALTAAEKALDDGRDGQAASAFEDILDEAPDTPRAHYGLARASARLKLDAEAIDQLRALWELDDYEAVDLLGRAATAPDFAALRTVPAFKVMTGYVHVTLATSDAEQGADELDVWARALEEVGTPVARTLVGGQPSTASTIFYRRGYGDDARAVADALGIPGAKRVEVTMDGPDDVDDIIAIWASGEETMVQAPIVQGTSTSETRDAGDLTDAVDGVVGDGKDIEGAGKSVGDLVP